MIHYFQKESLYFVVQTNAILGKNEIEKLNWLFGNSDYIKSQSVKGYFIGPRKEMISPWSTNAVEICRNMGIDSIRRIEELLYVKDSDSDYDSMLQTVYKNPGQAIFDIDRQAEPIIYVDNIAIYNKKQGLALSDEEVEYLNGVEKQIGRKLTDSEVYGFAQVNSEHCRHKIFNGSFIIDGKKMPHSLFDMIKRTAKEHPNAIVSAYKDNVAFVSGPSIQQFAPCSQDKADFFETKTIKSIISLKAETHNFPTTVEPFNGAATGSGGEIRDRMAGGKGSIPLAGTAVYMTSYPRHTNIERPWEKINAERNWLYQSPLEILIKASNGASDFGNKFGQPLINGSLFTFENMQTERKYGFDKVIMQAGGVGYARERDAQKDIPAVGDKIVVMGGDNYRIGMGGGAVSSVATGEFASGVELNAVQRSNPEMQKRVQNVIRAMTEMAKNPIISIHDHGAGGHLNSLSELVEATGGYIELDKLPVGDSTLSAKEIIGNESQERMGLIVKPEDIPLMQRVAQRERAPFYVVGEVSGDMRFVFKNKNGVNPIDLDLAYLFGKPPKTVLVDKTLAKNFSAAEYTQHNIESYLHNVLSIEAVACKDWLTNKVDRSVSGRVAKQQCAGTIQLPLNNLGVMALDYQGKEGIATSLGHAPAVALIDECKGSRIAVAKALTNIVWAPLKDGINALSLSANWMWPAKNTGENARLYKAVEALSNFVVELGINVPTGKDSLSMKQKYEEEEVLSPGTVVITAVGHCTDINKVIEPVLVNKEESKLYYIDFSKSPFALGGSSFFQTLNVVGTEAPDITDSAYFIETFECLQTLIGENVILAGHDISAGGLITTLLEMTFAQNDLGLDVDLTDIGEKDLVKVLFSENPSVVVQVSDNKRFVSLMNKNGIGFHEIATINTNGEFKLKNFNNFMKLDIAELRDIWYKTSYYFDRVQTKNDLALSRFENYKNQDLHYRFPEYFEGKIAPYKVAKRPIAAIIREKGVNGDREMAFSLFHAGFEVKDVHMMDLISGTEDLSEVSMIVFVGGFSNSDVLGSAKGWAGAFLYNPKAKEALNNFYARKDTLSLGVCNGCQLMVELNLIYPQQTKRAMMQVNDSHKFESAFLNVEIGINNSIMLKSLAGSRLGVWVAHGEGKFILPEEMTEYNIPIKYAYEAYPGNPNGSDYNAAALCSDDGRHLAMMPHLERAIFNWQWANYPSERADDEITPWYEAFVNARNWLLDIH